MEKYCNSCRQAYSSEQTCCPACGAALVPRLTGDSRNGHQPDATLLPALFQPQPASDREPAASDHEIDLGSPVSAGQPGTGGPLSGDSFVSWSARLEQKQRPPPTPAAEPAVQIDPPSAARLRLEAGRLLACSPEPEPEPEPAGSPEQAEAPAARPEEQHGDTTDVEVDLGGPVTGQTGDSGPLSGASGVGWAALLRARKQYEDPNHPTLDYHNPAPLDSPHGAASQPAAGQPRSEETALPPAGQNGGSGFQLRGVVLGFLLGVGACGVLWSFGCEPPQSWRKWLGRSAPQSPAAQAPGGNSAPEAALPP